MNKAFKVIWNHATQSWTAVSEIARSKGKTKSVKTAKTALAAAVAVAATSGSAYAAMAVGGTAATAGTTNNGEVTVVNGGVATAGTATVTGSAKGMAIGQGASVSFDHTNAGLIASASGIAMGYNATVNDANRAVVIGGEALASGANAVVIGANATAIKTENASANGLVVIGNDALIRNVNTISNQNSQSRGSTAIGANSLAGLLTEKEAAIGAPVSLTDADYNTQTGGFTAGRLMYRAGITDETGATVGGLQANEATAIGFDARAIGDQSIAIGAQVVAGHSSVALGGNDMGVAANTSNRAIYKSIAGADLASNILPGGFYETTYAKDGSVAIGQKAHSNELFGTAIGTSAFVEAGAELGTAIGAGARVGKQTLVTGNEDVASTADFTTKGGVAIAAGAVAERDYTTAIGTGSKANQTSATAMGYQALASGVNATAVGAKAVAAAADALAYGGNATAYATNSVAVGTNSTVTATGDSSIAFGTDTSVSGIKTVALGSNIKNVSTDGSVVLGDSSTAVVGTTGASHKVGTVPDAVVKSPNGAEITYGGFKGQPKDAGKYVSIGAVGAERQLKNVAAGNIDANSTDGINGSQLYSIAVTLGDQVFQSTYFHVNNVTNKDTGNSTTNLGNITDAAGATGQYAVTAGVNATSSSENAIAIGHDSTAGFKAVTGYGVNAIAIGQNSTSSSGNSIAIGTNATVKSEYLGDNADGTPTYSVPLRAIAIGSDSAANGLNSVALGPDALAGENFTIGYNTVAIGNSSTALAQSAIAMGYNSKAAGETSIAIGVGASTASYSDGTETTAIGSAANAGRGQATALGAKARANGSSSLALGSISNAVSTSSIALGTWTQAEGTSAHAIGHRSAAYGDRAMAEGRNAVAANVNASASGVRSVAAGTGSIAIGTNSASGLTRTDADAIIAANDAYTLAMYRDYIAQNKLAADPTNASTIAEAQQTAANLAAARTAVDVALTTARVNAKPDTVAIGTNTTVLGQESAAIGYTNTVETTANGTYVLGSNITATKDNNVILGQNSSEDSATTTKGVANQVNDATVGGATYGGFAGTATGIVSVGAEGAERQIINVAPGEISETSTDAINGSQLYYVAEQAAKPLTITANTNADTDAELLEKQYAAGDGTQQQLGETLAIIGAKTNIALGENTDAATAGAYSARNIQTVVTNGQVQIQMATNPVFNSTVIGGKFDQDGNQVGKPITIGTDAAGNNTISNLTTVIPVPATAADPAKKPTGDQLTNAATLGDVLNAGWNLKENGGARDVVTPYDTVDFINGNGTTVSIETNDNVSKVKVDVNLSDSAIIGDITNNTNGTASVGDNNDGNKLANISTVVDAINNSGWNVTSGNVSTGVVSGTTEELVKPGETVKFIAGKNIELTQDVNNFTFAVSNNPVFNSTTIGGTFDKDGNQVGSPIVIGTTPDGKNVISNLNTTLPEPSTVNGGKSGKLPDNVTTTNAATLGDVLNAGWNLKTADKGNLDFVKPYDTVNFKNGNGTTVVSSTDGNVSSIQYDVKVDNSTVKINSTTGAIEAVQPVTQVNGGNVTGPVNLVNGNTTTVTNTPEGIKVEVNTGNTTVGTDGKAAPLAPADANKVATVGDIVNTINNVGWFTNSTNALGNTVGTATNKKISAGQAVNFEAGDNMQITQAFDANGNVTYTYATKQDVSFNSTNIGAAGNPITIGTVNGDNVISNLGDNLPSTSSTSDKPTTTSSISPAEAAKLAEEKGGNAATVNDVLNAGWNLETNGKPLDFVKPYDTVNFKDGNGTTIVSTTDGATSNIQVDVAVDNSTIKIVDGKLTAVSSKPSITDNQSGDQAGDINFNNTNTTTVNVDDKGNVTVDVNTGTSSATDTGLATPATDKDGNPLVKVVDPVTGDVTYTNAAGDVVDAADVIDNSDKVATVGDIVNTINNTGWQATSGAVGTGKVEGTTTEVVKPSELVTFQAGDNMVLKQEGQVFTYSVSPTPVFTNVTAKEGITLGDPNSTGPVVEMKPVTATTPVNATGSTNAPVNAVDMGGATFTNLAPNLPETVSTGNATTSTPEQKAPVVTDAQKSNAATLGDVLNAGWNLQNNGAAKDFVKPYDTVNFANGTGTVARVDTDGNVSNVYYDVAVDGTTTEITYTNAAGVKLYKLANGTYNTQKDGKGTTVAAGDITGSRVSAILPTTKVNGGDVTGPVNLVNGNTTTVTNTGNGIKVEVNTTPLTYDKDSGKVNTPAKPNAIATAGDVANAINNSGWKLAAEGTTGTELVNPSETVTFKAGDNMVVSRDGANITYATKKEVSFDKVTVGPVTINKDTGINAGNTKIAGVAAGTEDTDAVNVAQLKAAQTTVGSADQSVKVQETVSANGQRHYDLSVNLDSAVLKPINDRIDDLEDESRAGIAGTAAMINIPQVTRPGANLLGVGLGHHKGESALAVGFSSASDNERLIFKMTGSANTQGDFTIGTGMGWQW